MARSAPSRTTNASPSPPAPFDAPAVCRAGLFQFAANQQFRNGPIQSRALFWCKSGQGAFEVDGVRYSLEPHDLYVLPWNRHITYLPAARDPMYTAHVHLVPWYRPGAPWIPNVPHAENEVGFDSPDRRDLEWPIPAGVVRLNTRTDELLGRLIEYATRWYLETPRQESEARALGLLLTQEVIRTADRSTAVATGRPEELRRLIVYIERGFPQAPNIQDLANIIGRSRSHVLKLFRRHLGVSAKAYIINRQMREAKELLLSTTLPVSMVGRNVGLPDPYHFSKLFRRLVGLSPRKYRVRHGPFSASSQP